MYQTMFKKRSTGLLTALAGLLLVSACTSNPRVATVSVRERPDESLMADCPAPVIQLSTNGQLAQTVARLLDSLAKCNIDKAAIRQWADSE